jgi:hypothetical protein
MERIEAALEKLTEAVEHLGRALTDRQARAEAERVAREQALEAARDSEARARTAVTSASAQLDGAIGRLQAALED